ncbi:hypothetical protein EHO59_08150 [Leptospira semungkisensis]|uniref:Uncharacterized protein n=1 Tax=Leptospira semungkisensis TaxID=2484985 RepID=A0A4V3JC59_9LEPT|nr:hypothetical protein [Leptospira semungkisensis]TGK04819.1 hypothetical protein EHO59_08150 [Leptospira semungkisensis]
MKKYYRYLIFQTNRFIQVEITNGYCDQEEEMGKELGDNLYKIGIRATTDSATDWGYVIDIIYMNIKYILYLAVIHSDNKAFAICLESSETDIHPDLISEIIKVLNSDARNFNITLLSQEEWNQKFIRQNIGGPHDMRKIAENN